ncbi:hypothetical protein KXV85_001224, partial [Aspergillus fumigatus]
MVPQARRRTNAGFSRIASIFPRDPTKTAHVRLRRGPRPIRGWIETRSSRYGLTGAHQT